MVMLWCYLYFITIYHSDNSYDEVSDMLWCYLYFITIYHSDNSYDEVMVMLWCYLYFITFYYSGNNYDGVRVIGVSSRSAIFLYIVITRKTRTAIANRPVQNYFKSECLLLTT